MVDMMRRRERKLVTNLGLHPQSAWLPALVDDACGTGRASLRRGLLRLPATSCVTYTLEGTLRLTGSIELNSDSRRL